MSENRDNLAALLHDCVVSSAEQVLYVFDDEELTAQSIWESVCRMSAALRSLGIERGSRIMLMLPNIPDYVVAYYAILCTGAVVVPVNVMLRERELHFLMEDCEARAIIVGPESLRDVQAAARHLVTLRHVIVSGDGAIPGVLDLRDLLQQHNPDEFIADVRPDDTAVILYTAGITGRPKGAELSHHSLMGNAFAGVNLLQIKSKDRLLGVLPLFHAFGQTAVMNAALAAYASVVLLPAFDPEITLKAVQEHRISIVLGTPSMYSLILSYAHKDQYDFSAVRYCVSGGSALKPDLMHAFEKQFSTTILEGYGLCETTSIATFNHLSHERRPGSIGTPIEGVEVRLLDDSNQEVVPGEVGEITVRSDYLMKGYLNRPEATRAVLRNGWFYTGDLARADEDGYLYIIDRKTDMIVKAGFNIYPVEIERLLLAHPSIAEVAVIGVPDAIQGEEIKACIVLRVGSQLSAQELANYCRERLARYKCPRYIQFYQQLPKSPSGWILKKKLRELSSNNVRG